MNYFYSSIQIPSISIHTLKLNKYSTKDHFYAFFSRPNISEILSKEFKSYLIPVIYELMDNAYLHGKASQFEIKIENNTIQLTDNGIPFDSTTELDHTKVSSSSNIGSFVFMTFLDRFPGKISTKYTRTQDQNVLDFIVHESVLALDDNAHYELAIDLKNTYGRENARYLAEQIPTDKEEIVLNIANIYNMSVLAEFTQEALKRITEKQTLTISMPKHRYLALFESWFHDERLKIKIR